MLGRLILTRIFVSSTSLSLSSLASESCDYPVFLGHSREITLPGDGASLAWQAESARDDGAFLAITLAAFLLPALVILGIAVGTGYLDKLAGGYSGGMY